MEPQLNNLQPENESICESLHRVTASAAQYLTYFRMAEVATFSAFRRGLLGMQERYAGRTAVEKRVVTQEQVEEVIGRSTGVLQAALAAQWTLGARSVDIRLLQRKHIVSMGEVDLVTCVGGKTDRQGEGQPLLVRNGRLWEIVRKWYGPRRPEELLFSLPLRRWNDFLRKELDITSHRAETQHVNSSGGKPREEDDPGRRGSYGECGGGGCESSGETRKRWNDASIHPIPLLVDGPGIFGGDEYTAGVEERGSRGVDCELARHIFFYDYGDKQGSVQNAMYEGVIAGATEQTIDVEGLLKEFPRNFEWLRAGFLKESVVGEAVSPGSPNTKMMDHVQRLIETGIAEKVPRAQRGGLPSGFLRTQEDAWEFTFIISCKVLNAQLTCPLPPCRLPALSHVVELVLSRRFFCEFDFRSYFFQFPIPESARVSGSVFVSGRRSCGCAGWRWDTRRRHSWDKKWHCVCWRRRCGGAGAGARATGAVWLDNVILAADDEGVLELVRARFRAVCEKFRVTLGESSPVVQRGVILGLELDTVERRWRMAPAWVEKKLPVLKEMIRAGEGTLRRWWQVFGMILWRCFALSLPMFGVPASLILQSGRLNRASPH